jgi:D-lactate dehydrogenase
MATLSFFEVSPAERVYLRQSPLRRHALKLYTETIQEAPTSVLRQADVISVFIYSQVNAADLKKARRLRLIATRSTGFDHIDLTACRKRKIAVATVPSYGENSVAEHTFALILALSRKVRQAYHRAVRGDFSFEGLQGFDLRGKVLGVVGTGHIGLHTVRIAKGFAMEVIAYDVKRNNFMAETLGYRYVDLDYLLKNSDIISLHAPYNKYTHHLINRDNIQRIKLGAILINTARGALVDTEALVWALDQGIIGGAGLDVLEGEELIKEERQILSREFPIEHLRTLVQNHILLNRENVVITPHIAFNSKEAYQRVLETTVQNILSFLDGRPENLVT